MSNPQGHSGRKRFFGRVRRRRRVRYITLLPSLITILNGVLGFAAIVFAGKGAEGGTGQLSYFAMAGYMVLLAMFADMLDGRLARMSQSTSSFGGQLDSLCDMVSFGIAPAYLMLKVVQHTSGLMDLGYGRFAQRFVWMTALAYVSCAAIRLARFNVESERNESQHVRFVGLPSPAAAGLIVSVIIFHQEQAPSLTALVYTLPIVTLWVAVLMVSRIRYPHVLNLYLKGEKPFAHLIRVLFFLGLVLWSMQTAIVLLFLTFAASGFLRWTYTTIARRKGSVLTAQDGPDKDALNVARDA